MVEIVVVLAAVVVGTLSIARLTRLVTQDSFPPSAWFRSKWDALTDDGPWSTLAHCPFCISLWIAIPVILWGWLSNLHISWWLFNGWMAVSYLAAIVVMNDGE
jgi:undecaprenyl pyrophosphate phosphatase UppP